MSATILAFPRSSAPRRRRSAPLAGFTPAWCEHHLPLIDAALDLLQADDVEFDRRCRLMADEDGRDMLDDLAGQIERLAAHVSDVADALGMRRRTYGTDETIVSRPTAKGQGFGSAPLPWPGLTIEGGRPAVGLADDDAGKVEGGSCSDYA